MKHLKPLILEMKQVGIIYHYTGIWNLYEMIKYKDFKIKSDNNYISFSRNPMMFTPEIRLSKLQTRIMIDGTKLSSKYKILPYKDFRNVDREHGEWEERVNKVDDLFMLNPVTRVDILDCIIEIDILDEPIFRGKDDKYFKNSANNFMYEPNNYILPDVDIEKVITKHKEVLDKIKSELENKKYSFDINIVSKFLNPKYQDRAVILKLN